MNPDLQKLQPYPFEKLSKLLSGIELPKKLRPIPLSIGEPKHPSPEFVVDTLKQNLDKLAVYPTTKGIPELRESIANWATRRFKLKPGSLSASAHVLPVNGTREAIFSFTQAMVNRDNSPLIISPNPFYQIYEGATFLAGAELKLLSTTEDNHFIPDYDAVSETDWRRCEILFLCSPGNPTGAVTPHDILSKLISLADKYDFIIASDECYSEIYCNEDQPPIGLLQTCAAIGRHDFSRAVVFHSLSKRSNLPGLRSGFIAGDATLLPRFLQYRTYHGSAMSVQHQLASIAAWDDESHVMANRQAYKAKFKAVLDILGPIMDVKQSDASFYLWPRTPINDELFTQKLYSQQAVTVVPGSYLSRTVDGDGNINESLGENPGKNRIRMALVAPEADCIEAAKRIKIFIEGLK